MLKYALTQTWKCSNSAQNGSNSDQNWSNSLRKSPNSNFRTSTCLTLPEMCWKKYPGNTIFDKPISKLEKFARLSDYWGWACPPGVVDLPAGRSPRSVECGCRAFRGRPYWSRRARFQPQKSIQLYGRSRGIRYVMSMILLLGLMLRRFHHLCVIDLKLNAASMEHKKPRIRST